MLQLEIDDDGRGLAADTRHGVGLSSMRERAAELGGTFEIESSPGNGTHLRTTIPL